MNQKLLPIKVVMAEEGDFRSADGGGGPKKLFCEVSRALRNELASQVSAVGTYFDSVFAKWPGVPAIAKVQLKEDALAMSHRPTSLKTWRGLNRGPPQMS